LPGLKTTQVSRESEPTPGELDVLEFGRKEREG